MTAPEVAFLTGMTRYLEGLHLPVSGSPDTQVIQVLIESTLADSSYTIHALVSVVDDFIPVTITKAKYFLWHDVAHQQYRYIRSAMKWQVDEAIARNAGVYVDEVSRVLTRPTLPDPEPS